MATVRIILTVRITLSACLSIQLYGTYCQHTLSIFSAEKMQYLNIHDSQSMPPCFCLISNSNKTHKNARAFAPMIARPSKGYSLPWISMARMKDTASADGFDVHVGIFNLKISGNIIDVIQHDGQQNIQGKFVNPVT
jgi:hypothetical protein